MFFCDNTTPKHCKTLQEDADELYTVIIVMGPSKDTKVAIFVSNQTNQEPGVLIVGKGIERCRKVEHFVVYRNSASHIWKMSVNEGMKDY